MAVGPASHLAPVSGGGQDPENVRYVSSLSEKLEFFPGVDVRGNVLMEYKRGGSVGWLCPAACRCPAARMYPHTHR